MTDVIISAATSQSTLTVTPTSQSDFTTYSCYARNNLGYDSRSFVLVQLGKVLQSDDLLISFPDAFPVTRNVIFNKQSSLILKKIKTFFLRYRENLSRNVTFLLFFLVILLSATAFFDPPVIKHLETGSSFSRVSWKPF